MCSVHEHLSKQTHTTTGWPCVWVHGAGAVGGARSAKVANPLCVDMVLKRRIQSRQLIVPYCIVRSRQERVARSGAAKLRTVWHHEPQTCSYVTRGARRTLPSMPSLIAFVKQAGVGPCCYCRCAAAAAGHSQFHSAFCVPLSLPVAAGSVVSRASPGPARLPAPCLETKQC